MKKEEVYEIIFALSFSLLAKLLKSCSNEIVKQRERSLWENEKLGTISLTNCLESKVWIPNFSF